jgi:hypothetical protein
MRVYQEGQRSASDGDAVCPYGVGDWRVKTWFKGRDAAMKYWREIENRIAEPVVQTFEDVLALGLGIMQGDKRIDPASIYKEQAEPVAWMHKETGLLRRETNSPKGSDWDATYWLPLYSTTAPQQAEPVVEPVAEPMGGEVERLMSVLKIQDATITALRAALQQAEPVAWHFQSFEDWWDNHGFHSAFAAGQMDAKPLAKLAWEVAREKTAKQAEPVAEPVQARDGQ